DPPAGANIEATRRRRARVLRPAGHQQRPDGGDQRTSAAPRSASETSPITSPDRFSKPEDSDPRYTLARDEPANLDDSLGLLTNIVSVYERADDANRRLCNQAFFHRIFIEEDGDVRVEYERPFGSLCDTEEQMNALNWAAEAKKKGEVQTGQRVVT